MEKEEFEQWIVGEAELDEGATHYLAIFQEEATFRADNLSSVLAMVRRHYESDQLLADRLAAHGAERTAALLREKLPTNKKARSGELGEILAIEITERRIGWRVPVRRLRWKDGRDMALRGDDLTAVWLSKEGKLWLLKGESKSRKASVKSAIADAAEALDRDSGRPSRLSVLFVAERLREANESELAVKLETALTESFDDCGIEHLLFVLTGSDPEKNLQEHVVSIRGSTLRRHVVGLQVQDHGDFIHQVYEAY